MVGDEMNELHIDKYKQPDGWYKYPPEDPSDHETALNLLGHIAGFCGCGSPLDALEYMAERMRLIHATKGWNETAWKALGSAFASEGEKYFFYYRLDSLGFTEHGSSVPGWLTKEGIEFMEDAEAVVVESKQNGD